MKEKAIFFRIILIIFLAFAYFTCDDFNLLTGAMGYAAPSEIQKITAPDAEDNDSFGFCSSISGDYVIVGTDYEDGMGIDRGAAYILK
jgi:hypothetical protein